MYNYVNFYTSFSLIKIFTLLKCSTSILLEILPLNPIKHFFLLQFPKIYSKNLSYVTYLNSMYIFPQCPMDTRGSPGI